MTKTVPGSRRFRLRIKTVSCVEVDRKGAEFIGNKQTNSLTNQHTDTQLHILKYR